MATPEQSEVLTITFDGLRPSSRARLLRTVQTLRASGVIAYAIDVKTGLPIPERPGRHFGLYHLPNGHRLALVTPKHLHRYTVPARPRVSEPQPLTHCSSHAMTDGARNRRMSNILFQP